VQSKSFARNNCGSVSTGSNVVYTVPANQYSSTISQADADAKATADINSNGQTYANANGTCTNIYYNVVQSKSFTRNNCGFGSTGSSVVCTVPANQYSSTISQADADAKATTDINSNGQAYANANGVCTNIYYNAVQSKSFTRNNCGSGFTGSSVVYTVPASQYSSTISQADADAKATTDINSNGQTYANANGVCTNIYYNAVQSKSFTRNNCGSGFAGSSVVYTVPAAKYASTVSQADADAKATTDINSNGQTYANTNGTCTRIYYNVVQSKSFTRNNCGSGFVGSSVVYTVPAAKYSSTVSQSDADSKATAAY
jgi:hypothetical protein